ncbi:MAG TPA: ClpXP protease specificity-enhancing factor SspB [Xanthobacteraceae bacterium]
MTIDYIRYDILTQDALRSVVHTVLADVAAKGLPGEHHFFISIDTRADGVGLSPRLKAQYPKEMTIVLQHQFWDMIVTDDRFEVGLSFNGVPERLVVPLRAIKGFADPSVQFGLQFAVAVEGEGDETVEASGTDSERPPARHERTLPVEPPPVAANPPPAAAKPGNDSPSGGEVVRLDRFRKK